MLTHLWLLATDGHYWRSSSYRRRQMLRRYNERRCSPRRYS